MNDAESGFFSRWSRRKALVREGVPPPEPPAPPQPPAATAPAQTARPTQVDAQAAEPAAAPPPAAARPPPTLVDVESLGVGSDYTRFVRPDVTPEVRNAALKRLFSDAQFNVMDGLDVYIDDYGKPDPLPPGMLRKMAQAHVLGLFDHEKAPDSTAAVAEPPPAAQSAEAPDAEAAAASADAPDAPDAPVTPTDPLADAPADTQNGAQSSALDDPLAGAQPAAAAAPLPAAAPALPASADAPAFPAQAQA